jgi:lysophospholipase L1-like esterase
VQRATFISHLTSRLKTLVEKVVLMRPQAHIILSNIVPMETNSFEPVSRDYAGAVKNLVIQEQRENHLVTYADPYHRFVKSVNGQTVPVPGLMSPGGIHPTPTGYQLLGRVYAVAVRAVLSR